MHLGIELRYPDPSGRWSLRPWVYLAHRRWAIAPRSVDVVACATPDALILSEAPGLRCFEAANGEERWRNDDPRAEVAWPALTEERVFVAHRDAETDRLDAIALTDGAVVWQRSWKRAAGEPTRTARVAVSEGVVVVSRGPDPEGRVQITACDAASGEERWSQALEAETLPEHLILGGDALAVAQGTQLRIHNLSNGELRWWHDLGKQPVAHLAHAGETWVAWSAGRSLTAFDPAGGVRWRRTFSPGPDPIPTSLRLDPERIQIIDDKRYSFDLLTGEEIWRGLRPQGASQVIALTPEQAYVHYVGDPFTAYGWLSSPLLPPASGAACAAINVAGSVEPPPTSADEGPKLADLRRACERLRDLDPDDDDAAEAVRDALTSAIASLPVGRATEKVAEAVCEAALRQALERGGTALFAAGQVGDALHEALRTYRWEVANLERRVEPLPPELPPTPKPAPAQVAEKVPSDIEPIPLDVLKPSPGRTWSPPITPPAPPPPPQRDLPWVQLAQAALCVAFAAGALVWMLTALR